MLWGDLGHLPISAHLLYLARKNDAPWPLQAVLCTSMGAIVLFQLLMLMVALIMLNLLIAIMNSAYEQVQAMAQLEVLHEKSLIILGIERLWLPVLRKLGLHRDRAAHARGGRPGGARARHEGESEDFPRWLHLLVPTALLHPDEYV